MKYKQKNVYFFLLTVFFSCFLLLGDLDAKAVRGRQETLRTASLIVCVCAFPAVFFKSKFAMKIQHSFRPFQSTVAICLLHSRPHEKFGKIGKYSKLSKFPRPKIWKWTITARLLLVHFQILESLKNMRGLVHPLWGTLHR